MSNRVTLYKDDSTLVVFSDRLEYYVSRGWSEDKPKKKRAAKKKETD